MMFRLLSLFLLVSVVSSLLTYYVPNEEDDLQPSSDSEEGSPLFLSLRRTRSDMRLCGQKLISTMKGICKGCLKPIDADVQKRSDIWSPPVKRQSLVESCCRKKCTYDFLRQFCCQV